MKSVAAALLHLLQLLRPWLLIIIVVALPGEISFTPRKLGSAEVLDLIVATDNPWFTGGLGLLSEHKKTKTPCWLFQTGRFELNEMILFEITEYLATTRS
jgi:hypothetical protein